VGGHGVLGGELAVLVGRGGVGLAGIVVPVAVIIGCGMMQMSGRSMMCGGLQMLGCGRMLGCLCHGVESLVGVGRACVVRCRAAAGRRPGRQATVRLNTTTARTNMGGREHAGHRRKLPTLPIHYKSILQPDRIRILLIMFYKF
jgi:hypothetical protein